MIRLPRSMLFTRRRNIAPAEDLYCSSKEQRRARRRPVLTLKEGTSAFGDATVPADQESHAFRGPAPRLGG